MRACSFDLAQRQTGGSPQSYQTAVNKARYTHIIEVGVVDVRAAPVHTVVATVTVKSWCVARVAGLPKCVNKHIRAVVCTAGGADVYGVKNQML